MEKSNKEGPIRATAYGGTDASVLYEQGTFDKWATVQNHATASGAADAPVSRDQGTADKYATGQQPQQQKLKKISPKTKVRIATWNVRTASKVGHKEIIARELHRCRIPIAALTELRIPGSGSLTIAIPGSTEETLLYYSGEDKRQYGVGFAVDKKLTGMVRSFQPISSRLAVLTLHGTVRVHLISVYAPTEMKPDEEKDRFYEDLQEVYNNIPKSDVILLAGDFNAHVGASRNGWEHVLGNFGYGKVNDNGQRLLTFASLNGLAVGNSLFRHPVRHKLTWRSPNGRDTSVLDYVLINNKFRSSLQDVRVMRGADCGSDHHLVCATLRLKLKKITPNKLVPPRYDLTSLIRQQRPFSILLQNRFSHFGLSEDVEEENNVITSTLLEATTQVCQLRKRKKQLWISDDCLDLIDERKEAKTSNYTKYKDLNRRLRKKLREERENYWDKLASEVEVAASKNQHKVVFDTINQLCGKWKSLPETLRNKNGTFTKSPLERVNRWREYFNDLLNHQRNEDPMTPGNHPMTTEEVSSLPPTMCEVKAAIKTLKSGKAAGEDGITAEHLKAGGRIVSEKIHHLLGLIWASEVIPSSWKTAIIVPVLKKGDNTICDNYRGISLLSVVGKVFTRIIQTRLQHHREKTSREQQAGFRPNRGCCDQIFTIRQLLERRLRHGRRTVVVFIDFKAAFDSVSRPALWSALEHENVPHKVINLLKNLYNGSSSKVRIGSQLSDDFNVHSGVKQGCVISPLLFNTVVDAVMRQAFRMRTGVQFSESGYITDLMFADDSAFFTETDEEATNTLEDIASYARSYGLEINTSKTKVMTSDGSPASVHLNGTLIEQVPEFKYLGSILEAQKISASSDIAKRIQLATSAFSRLNWCLWRKKNITLKTKMRLYRVLVLPVLLYGSETWTILSSEEKKLESFQMRCLRKILGVSLLDHLHNTTIRTRCFNQRPVASIIRHRRLQWFGHVCRMSSDRLPYQLLCSSKPQEWKYQPSGPRKTWMKMIEEDLRAIGLTLESAKKKAKDRVMWRKIAHNSDKSVAPTVVYWLRSQVRPIAAFKQSTRGCSRVGSPLKLVSKPRVRIGTTEYTV